MSAYLIVEFTVKDPDVYREQYASIAGKTAKEYGAEPVASSNWEVLYGEPSLTSGALMRFPDREAALELVQLARIPGADRSPRCCDGCPFQLARRSSR